MASTHSGGGHRIVQSSMITAGTDNWLEKRIFASAFCIWRSVMTDIDARIGMITNYMPNPKPWNTWGSVEQDLFSFVTHFNLKE